MHNDEELTSSSVQKSKILDASIRKKLIALLSGERRYNFPDVRFSCGTVHMLNDDPSANRDSRMRIELNLRFSRDRVMTRAVIENAPGVELKLRRVRGSGKDRDAQRVSSIDQSAISNAELLMAYRFIADGKSRTACYHVGRDLVALNVNA